MDVNCDFSQWGMTLSQKDNSKIIYNQDNSNSTYIFYNLHPGIEIIQTHLEEKHYWNKKIRYS